MIKKWKLVAAIVGVIFIISIIVRSVMSHIETPVYKVIKSDKNIEIRQYDPMLIAQVEVSGKREEAIKAGFRSLADYIFGNNTVSQSMAMTAPVQQQSMKIAMTAPVEQQSHNGLWQVSFVMPTEYTIKSLPKPVNKQVKIKVMPERQFVVIRFSGMITDSNIQKHEDMLRSFVKTRNLLVQGAAKYAFYNAPWTLPFLRRNEVMFELK